MLSTQNNQYHTLDELNGSESDGYVTFGSVSDHIQQSSSYNSEDEIASKKVGATIFNDEESMSIALKKAQILVDQEEKEDESEIDEETRVEILESKGKSAVVIIGEEIIVDYSGCCINKKWASKQTMDLAQKQSLLYQKYYLGPRSDVKAKDACSIRSSWHLYHRIEKSLSDAAASLSDTFQLPSTLHLYIIYRRNDNGQHEFYPIRSKTFPSRNTMFWADYGDPETPKFDSIYGLIEFYDNFGHVNINAFDSRRCYVTEVFPLWKRPARVPTISEYSALSSDISWIPEDSVFDDPTISTSQTSVSSFSSSISEGETNVDF